MSKPAMQIFAIDYYNARWYDPALNRFIQADTIVPNAGDVLAFDRYAYVKNNPLKYTDPTGHIACEVLGTEICDADGNYMDEPIQPPISSVNFYPPLDVMTITQSFSAAHRGLDLARPHRLGTESEGFSNKIYAPTDGVIVATDGCAGCWSKPDSFGASVNGGYGNVIVVEYPFDSIPSEVRVAISRATNSPFNSTHSLYGLYAHLASPAGFDPGDQVVAGQSLGVVGNTGNSTGYHLHMEFAVAPANGFSHGEVCIGSGDQCGGAFWSAWFDSEVPRLDPAAIPYRKTNPRIDGAFQ